MSIPKILEGEYRFCLIMWEHEPVSSLDLVKLCQEQLGWKRITTYTVIKRLGERGVLKLENGLVTALISKEEAEAAEIDTLISCTLDYEIDTKGFYQPVYIFEILIPETGNICVAMIPAIK